MADYELMYKTDERQSWWRMCIFVLLVLSTASVVFLIWSEVYENEIVQYPPSSESATMPAWYVQRIRLLANSMHDRLQHDFRLMKPQQTAIKPVPTTYAEFDNTLLHDQSAQSAETRYRKANHKGNNFRLVCYYSPPDSSGNKLQLKDVNATLCTHINVGLADVQNSSLVLSENLAQILRYDVPLLRAQNPDLKILLWIGGGDSGRGFPSMIKNHNTRKLFIQSVKQILRQYKLDGIDLDWEFPSAYNKERQHFSQLLYEIHQEYRREHRDYLLTVAVAAPEGIALFAYDVDQLNIYADFINLMSYDYHFYSPGTPFTGLNAPLYARSHEHSIMATLNINYSVHWWLSKGLDRNKLVVGLPTYGHSFTLVNPFNNVIEAPASGYGQCGRVGFTTYSEICWFHSHNLAVTLRFDNETCSPYLSCADEWISYENEQSIECKTNYIKSMQLGGAMAFSLNTDDNQHYCNPKNYNVQFPLIETMQRVLYQNN